MKRAFFALLAVAWLAQPVRAASPASCAEVDYGRAAGTPDLRASPPNPDGPTLVSVGIFVVELGQIDAVRETFHFSGYVRVNWCDPRLAFDAAAVGAPQQIFTGPDGEKKLRSIWYPAAIPVNEVGRLDVKDRVLRILADGNVEQDLNVAGTLGARYDLRRFPFDRQTLPIQVESFTWSVDSLRLVPNEERMGFAAGFTLPEWHVLGIESDVDEVQTIRSPRPFSRLVVELEVDRKAGFYLWKVLLPLFVIVALSWSVFWMGDERFAARSRITATGVLTIVAYQFVVGEGVPRIAYLTLLDKVMILSFGLLAVTVVESLWVSRYQDNDPERARRIDRVSRWAFPLFYAAVLAFVFVESG